MQQAQFPTGSVACCSASTQWLQEFDTAFAVGVVRVDLVLIKCQLQIYQGKEPMLKQAAPLARVQSLSRLSPETVLVQLQ